MFRVSLAAGRAAGMRSALRPTASPALLRPSSPLFLRPQAVRGPLSLRMMSTATVPPAVADAAAVQARRNKIMGGWLMTTSGLVFGIVVVGGLTRLTESGLSITDWRPVKGSIPPLTQEDWEVEFAKYKKSPEYIMYVASSCPGHPLPYMLLTPFACSENDGMTLDEFKKIFWMEWGHRQLGRFIGLAYVGPFAFFAARGWLRGRMLAATTGIGALIGVQGLIGWLMVKSGLEQKIIEDGEVPRVSHYRLAAHLGTAFAIYMASLWNGLTLLANYGNDYKLVRGSGKAGKVWKVGKEKAGKIFVLAGTRMCILYLIHAFCMYMCLLSYATTAMCHCVTFRIICQMHVCVGHHIT